MPANSTSKRARRKRPSCPKPPIKGFPLQPHPSGACQKRIRNNLYYFGRCAVQRNGKLELLPDDQWWRPALELYRHNAQTLHEGRSTAVKPLKLRQAEELTAAYLCNRFPTRKVQALRQNKSKNDQKLDQQRLF